MSEPIAIPSTSSSISSPSPSPSLSSPSSPSDLSSLKSRLSTLDAQRLQYESRISSLHSSPSFHSEPLVDSEGFPRSDIDVYAIRATKGEVATLQSDHRNVMKEIENVMGQIMLIMKKNKERENGNSNQKEGESKGNTKSPQTTSSSSSSTTTSTSLSPSSLSSFPPTPSPPVLPPQLRAFYIVDSVLPNSPADICDLHVGDRIVSFGSVHYGNFTPASMVGITQSSVGKVIRILVLREEKKEGEDINTDENKNDVFSPPQSNNNPFSGSKSIPIPRDSPLFGTNYTLWEIFLTPNKWDGQGLLGCHLKTL